MVIYSKGTRHVDAGQTMPGNLPDTPMQVSSTGTSDLKALVMFVADATKLVFIPGYDTVSGSDRSEPRRSRVETEQHSARQFEISWLRPDVLRCPVNIAKAPF